MSRSRRNAKAEDYQRRATNYSAEAMVDIDGAMKRGRLDPETARIVGDIRGALAVGTRFILPDHGRILGDGLTVSMIVPFRLPYPVTIVEFTSTPKGPPTPDAPVPCPARIAACWEQGDGAVIWPVSKVHGEVWVPSWVGLRIAYGQTPKFAGREDSCVIFDDFRVEYLALGQLGRDAADRAAATRVNMVRDTSEEMIAVFQLCAALACTNVETEQLTPPAHLKKAHPQKTFLEYRTLVLKPGVRSGACETGGGHHASPRQHLRRGHIRQHATAGRVWVNACVVNAGAEGEVRKAYEVRV